MLKNRDFVIVGIQPWDIGIGSNCKNIALELSKHNRVLYINQPLDRITSIRYRNTTDVAKRLRIINGKEDSLVKIETNLWTYYPKIIAESINKLPDGLLYNFLNRRNNKRFAKEIRKICGQLNFENVILFNDSLMFLGFYLKELLRPSLAIYYIRDNLTTQEYFKKHGLQLETLLATKYDIVVSNSDYLAQLLAPFNKNTFMIGQGCDFTLFNPQSINSERPFELATIQSPIIGYVGFLTSMRLDINLLESLAKESKDYNIVLVGPEDEDFKSSKLHQYKNVHFIGSKPEADLPQYINSFDVCINPQVINGMTIGNYPRKVDEYLALGKPTVATRTETMEYFSEHVYLCNTSSDYIANIKIALLENSNEKKEKRIAFALSHTWKNSVDKIYQAIEYALAK